MSLKGKAPPELKVEDYLVIREGLTQIKDELGIRFSIFQSWLRKNQTEGSKGLYPKKGFTVYLAELKLVTASTTVLWRDFGAFLKQKCIIYSISIPLRNYSRQLMNTFFFTIQGDFNPS